MKLAMISKLFPNATHPLVGQFNLQLANALSRQTALEVIAPVPGLPGCGAVPERTDRNGFGVRQPRFFAVPLLNRAIAGHSLARCLRRLPLDADALLATFAWPDGYAAVQLGIPTVVKIGGSDIDLLPRSGLRRAQTIIALQRCRHAYVVASHLRDKIANLGVAKEKVAVIHNGIDPAVFHPRDQREARHALGLPQTGEIILYVGWIESDKGVEYLLRAHAALKSQSLLVLIGNSDDPGFRRQMETLVRSLGTAARCQLIQAQPHAQIATWLSAADIFAFPSLHEGCPNVVLEALACGLPMVATNVGGIPEITPHAPWCELVPPRDAPALTFGLQRLLATSWPRQQIAQSSQRTWDDVARDVLQVIQSVTTTESVTGFVKNSR